MKHIQWPKCFLDQTNCFRCRYCTSEHRPSQNTDHPTNHGETMQASSAPSPPPQTLSLKDRRLSRSSEPMSIKVSMATHRIVFSLIAQSLHCQRKSPHFQSQCLDLSHHVSPLLSATAAPLPRNLPPSFLPCFFSVPICC